MASEGDLHFVATIGDKDFMRSITEIRDAVVKTSRLLEQVAANTAKAGKAGTAAAQETGRAIDKADDSIRKLNKDVDKSSEGFGKLAKAAGAFFTLQAAQSFASKIFSVRSEIESLQTSFRVLVGDKDKADALFQGIKEFAVSTPMQMKDLASAAQTMMGFGLPLEEIMQNLKAIGDVSGGDAQRFQSLALSFSQMSAAGKLMGQDLMQMINAGFNPLAIIAEKTGKSMGKLKDEMSAGAISADMVRQAFIDATSEGGAFYGMLESKSKTLQGAYSNLQGAIDDMLNEMGEKGQGVFTTAIDMATTLAKNYETVGTVILGLIGTYGVYKATVMAVVAAEKGWTIIEGVHYALLVAQEKAQKLLNATMLANPYVAVAAALGLVVTATVALISRTSEVESETKKLNEAFANTGAEVAREQKQIDTLFDKLGKAKQGTSEYKSVKDQILSQYGGYLSGLSAEVRSLSDVAGAYRAVSKAARDAAMARGMEAAMKSAGDAYSSTYSTYYDKLFTAIEKNYGTETANKLMTGLQKKLQKDGKLSADLIDKFGALKGVKAGWLLEMSVNEGRYQSQRERIEQKFRTEDKSNEHKIAVRDKAVIEEEKKAAQAELDALSVIDAKGKKGKAIKDRINALDMELSGAYDPKAGAKASKAAAAAARQQAAAERKELQEQIRQGEAQEKIFELKTRQALENERASKDLEFSTREAIIKAKEESTDKVIEQIDLDYDREMEAIRRGAEDLKRKRIEEAKALWDANPNNKGKNFYESGAYAAANINTDDEVNNRIERERAATQEWMRNMQEVYDAESAAMRAYLRQYGTYQEQRAAITEEYDEKIRKAQADGERLMLAQQKQEALRHVDERFGLVTQAMADLFADASKKSVKAIQAIIDKYEKLVDYMEGHKGSANKDDLAKLGFSETDIQKILRGEISIKDLTDRLKELKGELANRSPYQSFIGNMDAIIKKLKEAKNAADRGTAISAMAGEINAFLPSLKEFGADIANIFGMDDGKFQGVMDSLGGLATAGGGVGQIMSGDIVGGVMTSVKGVSQMVDALDGLFGADYSAYENLVEQYDRLIDVWDVLIDKKTEYISMSYGAEAMKATQEAIDLLNKEADAWRNLGREWVYSGASAGSHSMGVRMRKRMGDADWQAVAASLGRTTDDYAGLGGRLEGLFDLTAEQLEKLRGDAPEFWAKLNDETQDYLNKIIEGAERLEDIQEQLKQQLTATTFDSVYDNFISSLSDMDKSAYDFSRDFEKYMFDAMLNAQVGDMFKKRIEKWYDDFAAASEDGIDTEEMAALRREWEQLGKEGLEVREELRKATGYGSSAESEATYGAVKSFTQEQGDVLNGRLTAIQMAVRENNMLSRQISESLRGLSSLVGMTSAVSDIRDMMMFTNTYLEDMVRYAKATYNDFGAKMDRIINQIETKL